MSRYALLLILATGAAGARTPAPVAGDGVPDRDAVRLMSAQYEAKARLHGDWIGRGDARRRRVCADSGSRGGDRYVAVCSPPADAASAGSVDLFVIEHAATQRGRARIRARFRGIGWDPRTGDPRLMAIAPDRAAFVLGTTSTAAGWTQSTQSLYAERAEGLRRLLTVGTQLDNRGTCQVGDDLAGRRCRQRRVVMACTLRADTARVDAGAWPLELHVTGERTGDAVNRIVPIPHDAYGYRISARVLETQGCDRGS